LSSNNLAQISQYITGLLPIRAKKLLKNPDALAQKHVKRSCKYFFFLKTNPPISRSSNFARSPYRMGRLSTVDPLIKIGCFVKNTVSVLKAADLN
jgi:hypothetical protein